MSNLYVPLIIKRTVIIAIIITATTKATFKDSRRFVGNMSLS